MAETKSRPVSREKLAKVFKDHETLVAFENLTSDVTVVIPENNDAAVAAAGAAQSTANSAAAAATAASNAAAAAQGSVNSLASAPFVTIGASAVTAAERALVVDPLAFTLTDAGPGSTVTLGSTNIIAVLPTDVSESAAVLANATGLAGSLAVNATYLVEALLSFQSAAVTTGIALAFTLPAGATMSGMFLHNSTATALLGSYNIASGAVKGSTTDVLAATENIPISGRWLIKTAGTAGAAQLQFRSEVNASAVTLKAGLSALVFRRIA